MKIAIIYWSSTGNTEKMARLIEKGFNQSFEIVVKPVSDCSIEDVIGSDIILLGSPAMGSEEIDTSEMAPFIESNKAAFENKSIALFGSYGWGSGEWMEEWQTMMLSYGAKIITDSLMVMETPEGQSEMECINFAMRINQL